MSTSQTHPIKFYGFVNPRIPLERWADECDKLDGHLVTQGAEIDRLRDLAAALEAENARLEAEADLWAKR